MSQLQLEAFLKRIQKRRALTEDRKVPLGMIKDAVIAYLQPMIKNPDSKEIIDVDIPGLTTDVDIKIYWR